MSLTQASTPLLGNYTARHSVKGKKSLLQSQTPVSATVSNSSSICLPDRSLPSRQSKIPALHSNNDPEPLNKQKISSACNSDFYVAVLSEAGPKFPVLLGLQTLQCRLKIPDLHCSCPQQDGARMLAPQVGGGALTLDSRWERLFHFSPIHTVQSLTRALPNAFPENRGSLKVTAGCSP